MILLPSAAGTTNAPALMIVPGGDVTIVGVWQIPQPMELKRLWPILASAVAASTVSRGGTFVARMKAANTLMSSVGSSPQVTPGFATQSALSGTGSISATDLPSDVFSTRLNRLVIPISFRYASDENDSRLACWFFQPKRPTLVTLELFASRIGTSITVPRMSKG